MGAASEKGNGEEAIHSFSTAVFETAQGDPPRLSMTQSRQLASLASLAAVSLAGLFVVTVLSAILPPKLIDPQWQLALGNALISSGPMALLGLLAAHLAAYVQPSAEGVLKRLRSFRQLAVAAALGYLLLIPLQLYGAWNLVETGRNARVRAEGTADQKLAAYREAITKAKSTADLQQRLQALKGPQLTPQALQQPLEPLRRTMLERLETSAGLVKKRTNEIGAPVGSLVRQSIRVTLSSLLLALGFAAGAQGRKAKLPLLESLPGRRKRR